MKKQIAVLMAAATAVTTVAPVLANAELNTYNNVSASEINGKIKEALAKRYADPKQDGINVTNADAVDEYMNSQYAVFISKNDTAPTADGIEAYNKSGYKDVTFEGVAGQVSVVTDASKIANFIEKNVKENLKVYIVDKGIKDKSSVYTTTNNIYVKDNQPNFNDDTQEKLRTLYNDLTDNNKVYKNLVDGNIDFGTLFEKLEFTLKSGEKISLKLGDEAIDLEKAYNKDGKLLDLENAGESVFKEVVKFGIIENKDKKVVTVDVPTGDTNIYSVADVENKVIDVPNVFTNENGYTNKGADFVNSLIKAKQGDNKFSFNYDGVNYELVKQYKPVGPLDDDEKDKINENIGLGKADKPVIEKIGDKYALKFKVSVKDKNDSDIVKTLQFVIEGKEQKDLAKVLKDFRGMNEVVAGHFTKLAGSNRYATAIEISREAFEKNDSADTVVIVGGNALMDGLSAGPLATAKNAPILLADAKSGLNNDTLNEIDRVCDNLKNKTVYIVGGDSSVPKSVEKQLKDKFGAVVVRISGKDRYETSLDVTRRLGYEKVLETGAQGHEKGNIYFVGGEGAADAMSIAGVASKFAGGKVNGPIVVVPKNEISRKTRDFISSKYFKKAYFIGGDGNLSTNVYKTPGLAKEKERVSGKDRFETNVEILNKKEFYTKSQVDGAIFASGDNKYLVDAQTSAVLSVDKKAPIVLTGKKLTDSQVDLLKKDGLLSGVKSNVYQVGGVVSADVMKVVVDKLGL